MPKQYKRDSHRITQYEVKEKPEPTITIIMAWEGKDVKVNIPTGKVTFHPRVSIDQTVEENDDVLI